MYWSQVRILAGPPFDKMKIAISGILPFSGLIKEGFEALGHVITNENPDLIYANDPRGYNEAIVLKKKYPKVNMIFNLLDIPWFMPNILVQTKLLVSTYLNRADAITVLSYKVKKDLSQFLNKKIHVIYNPVRDVYYKKDVKRDNDFLYVGRANDPNKRFFLVKESLMKIKDGEKKIKVCGAENPSFGNYLGYVSNEKLNEMYNSTKFLLLPSKYEGIGLPMIEAVICGCLPITCSDNETAKEFLPLDFICEPNPDSIVEHINKLDSSYKIKQELAFKLGKKYKGQFNKIAIAKNILSIIK